MSAPLDGGVDAAPPPAQCEYTTCADGRATTCDQQVSVDCSQVGGACQSFTSGTSTYDWCDCGTLGEGMGQCVGQGQPGAIICAGGQALPANCGPGTVCVAAPSEMYQVACDCDNLTDGICPDPPCPGDADCATCTPNCVGRTCGDNGCNGSCGSCGLGEACLSGAGTCLACVPSCNGKACGPDGCGGTCGTCASNATCNTTSGACETICVPVCTNRICGSDGCGGSCGACPANQMCNGGTGCTCQFFAKTTFTVSVGFTFAASAFVNGTFMDLQVKLSPLNPDGTEVNQFGRTQVVDFHPSMTADQTITLFGCGNKVKVERAYRFWDTASTGSAAVLGCTATDTVDSAQLVIPGPTPSFIAPPDPFLGRCTAPAL